MVGAGSVPVWASWVTPIDTWVTAPCVSPVAGPWVTAAAVIGAPVIPAAVTAAVIGAWVCPVAGAWVTAAVIPVSATGAADIAADVIPVIGPCDIGADVIPVIGPCDIGADVIPWDIGGLLAVDMPYTVS